MRSKISKLYELKNFFSIIDSNQYQTRSILQKPGRLLLQNIYRNWLQFNLAKTKKYMNIYTNKAFINKEIGDKIPYGYLVHSDQFDDEITIEHQLDKSTPKSKMELQVHLIVPQQDKMQYFMQWQRYRKFWWSSITTTPSLFAIDDIKQESQISEVNINAQFPWAAHVVESVKMDLQDSTAHLSCCFNLENAMITILLDSLNNSQDYLRIHRKMAPYKLSYAIDCKDSKNYHELTELATLLHYKLSAKKVTNYLPNFVCPFENQIKENLLMGVCYTAILTEGTLSNGIFCLLNSNTRLKEQVHIVDFDSYAALVCNK